MNEKKPTGKLYTLGIWTVKTGKETEFIKTWSDFAVWTEKNSQGTGNGYLLQDEKNNSRFISYGTWDDETSILKWRESEAFKEFVVKAKNLCDDFQPNTLKLVASSH